MSLKSSRGQWVNNSSWTNSSWWTLTVQSTWFMNFGSSFFFPSWSLFHLFQKHSCTHIELADVTGSFVLWKFCSYLYVFYTRLLHSPSLVLLQLSEVAWPPIDPSHKSQNAPVPYPKHYFVTEVCTFLLQNGALWDTCLMHCGLFVMDLLACVTTFMFG